MKHFLDVSVEANAEKYLSTMSEHSLVVYSPTSLSLMKVTSGKGSFISTHDIGKDTEKIEELCLERKIDVVIAIGGGTAIDIAKYIACVADCRFICIPTMLSTNAFATNKVALIKNEAKITLDAKLADEIILDFPLITKAGTHNLYGLCDILSMHTALYDWHLADKAGIEKIDNEIYRMSQNLLSSAVSLALESASADNLSMSSLYRMIGESGHITNIYGNGRPESGSEHIFAKELEYRIEIPHGISIAIGVILMSLLQGSYSIDIQTALRNIGVLTDIVYEYDLRKAITLSLKNLAPRKDRYTVLNEKLPTAEMCIQLIDKLYDEILGVTYEYSHS